MARLGTARQGQAWRGWVWRGKAWCAEAGLGEAGFGKARLGAAWHGAAWHGVALGTGQQFAGPFSNELGKMVFTIKQLANCVRREIALRRRVYGRKVSEGSMDPDVAAAEIAMMQTILEMLESKHQPKLF